MTKMSRNKRVAVAGVAAVALAALTSTLTIGTAQSATASCAVTARTPYLSTGTLFGRGTNQCPSTSTKMYVRLQGRWGAQSKVYTLGTGSTTGTYLKIGAPKCVMSGKWHMWTLVTRGLRTDTSSVLTYSCTR